MISVQLDWKPNAQFAGHLAADHSGLFAARGVEVEILPWEVHTDPVAGLDIPGRIAVSEDNLAIQSLAAGNDVIVLFLQRLVGKYVHRKRSRNVLKAIRDLLM